MRLHKLRPLGVNDIDTLENDPNALRTVLHVVNHGLHLGQSGGRQRDQKPEIKLVSSSQDMIQKAQMMLRSAMWL